MQIKRGWIHCNIQSNGMGMDNNGGIGHYNNQQLHKWSWTNSPALTIPNSKPITDNITSATMSVSGGGSLTTMDNNGITTYHASWTAGGSVGVTFSIWQDSNGTINITTPAPNVPAGYSVTQNNGPAKTFPVAQPPIPQTLFSGLGSALGISWGEEKPVYLWPPSRGHI